MEPEFSEAVLEWLKERWPWVAGVTGLVLVFVLAM